MPREHLLTCDSDVDQAKKKLSFSVRKTDKPTTLTNCDNGEQSTQGSNLCVFDIFPETTLSSNSANESTTTRKRKLEAPLNQDTVVSVENTLFTNVKPFTSTTPHENSLDSEVPNKKSMTLRGK